MSATLILNIVDGDGHLPRGTEADEPTAEPEDSCVRWAVVAFPLVPRYPNRYPTEYFRPLLRLISRLQEFS